MRQAVAGAAPGIRAGIGLRMANSSASVLVPWHGTLGQILSAAKRRDFSQIGRRGELGLAGWSPFAPSRKSTSVTDPEDLAPGAGETLGNCEVPAPAAASQPSEEASGNSCGAIVTGS